MKHSMHNGANKTDAGNGSKVICRVSNVLPSPSPDPGRSDESIMSRLVLLLSISCCLMGCKSPSQRKGTENEAGKGERDLPRETAVKVLDEPSKPIGELLKKLRRGMTPPMVRKALPPDLFWSLDSCDGHQSLVEGFELGDDVFVAFSYVNAEAKGNDAYTPEESEDHLKLEKALAVPMRREYRGGVYTLTREFESPLVVVVYGKESE